MLVLPLIVRHIAATCGFRAFALRTQRVFASRPVAALDWPLKRAISGVPVSGVSALSSAGDGRWRIAKPCFIFGCEQIVRRRIAVSRASCARGLAPGLARADAALCNIRSTGSASLSDVGAVEAWLRWSLGWMP